MDFFASAWFLPVAASVWTLLLAFFVVGYFFAIRPNPGSLQWIADFDPPAFTFAGSFSPITFMDGFWMCVIAIFGVVASYAMHQSIPFDTSNFAQAFFSIASYIVLPMVSCAAAFWLMKSLTGDLPAAFWGSILVALDVFSATAPVSIVVLTAALLYGYTNQPHQAPLWQRVWILGLLGGLFSVGIYFYGGMIFLLIPIFTMIFTVNYENFRATGKFWFHFLLHLGLFILFAVVAIISIFTPVALVNGLSLIGTALQPEFYTMLFAHLDDVFTSAFYPFAIFYALFTATTHWPLLIAGLSTLPPLLHGIGKLRLSSGLFILIFGFAILLIWLLTGISALFFAVALGLSFAWSRLKSKDSLLLLISWSFALFIGILLMFMMILV